MLASIELLPDFKALDQQLKSLVADLVDEVDLPPVRVEVAPTPSGNFRGFDGAKFYVLASGTISARYNGRTVCLLDQGDLLMPDVAGNRDPDATVYYGSEAGASLDSYTALEFMQRVIQQPRATKLWTRVLVTYSGLMLRLTAAYTAADVVATPGFELYEPGDVIIQQGDRAQYVFNMTAGVADVMVDDVVVGRVGEGEIFGAMAALTNADRSATVRARTACSVVKVPTSQFTDLIKTNPTTIHSLLTDMANSIVSLNDQIVKLQGRVDHN
jgi:CRP/FNR family cyclic AMP-dependent transcriptional regulator